MRGKHHIIIETDNLKYEFDIKRNITVIQGDSATGKTTLVDIISEASRAGNRTGIRIISDVPCFVFSGNESRWQYELDGYNGSIVFIDEDYRFIYSQDFAGYVSRADNYFVLITRRPLKNLPYSIKEIYGIRTSGRYHFPEQVYHEFYPIYKNSYDEGVSGKDAKLMILVEDKKAGYQFYERVIKNASVISAEGNTGLYSRLISAPNDNRLLIIADGAALGAYVDPIVKYAQRRHDIGLYFPESFEWIVLKSGVIRDESIREVLEHPEDFIDSQKYISWERFFTSLLREKTNDRKYMKYNKDSLPNYYTEEKPSNLIIKVIPEEIRDILFGD